MNKPQRQFVELFLRNQNRIFGFILTLVLDRTDADDLLQQTSLTMWEKWDEFDPSRDFVKWACGIAFNHIRNHRRQRRHHSGLTLDDQVMELVARRRIDAEAQLHERRLALRSCMSKLPAEQRQLLRRCYTGNETIKSVAERFGLAPKALYKTLERIRGVLFHCISRSLDEGDATQLPEALT